MKRSLDSPPLGANYGATVRLEGPNAPLAVFRPASELERIRNPFLPPDAGPGQPVGPKPQEPAHAEPREPARAEPREPARAEPREPVDAEFENSGTDLEGRESDVWSNDAPSRRVLRVAPSGKMIVGSFLVFAVLGAGGFAALYTAVHANDAANRATYEVDDSRGTTANANAMVPVTAPGPGPTPIAPSAALEPANAAGRIDSGAPMFGVTPTTKSTPSEAHRSAVAPAPGPARMERAPVRKTPIVVHVEPAPVFPSHRETDEKDGPVSEDALLVGSAHSAEAVQPQPPAEPGAAGHAEPVPTGNENPDDPRK
jgi:hypothetical protein